MAILNDERRSIINRFAAEFERNYLLEPAGQRHMKAYGQEREQVKKYWEELKSAKKQGEPITGLVLYKMLPYSNTRHNRENGYRISIAPAVTKDIKKWFENAGWQKSDNWDKVAEGIYNLIYDLIESDDWQSLKRFEENRNISIGIKSGFISITLHYLNSKLRILNGKTIDTVNFIAGEDIIGRDLSGYKDYLNIINSITEELNNPLFTNDEVFDAFCHWMCDKRLGGYARHGDTIVDDYTGSVDDEIEPSNHWEAIFFIVKLGNLLDYKTYVADPSKSAFGEKLGNIATLKQVPQVISNAPNIERVDVIWYKCNAPYLASVF